MSCNSGGAEACAALGISLHRERSKTDDRPIAYRGCNDKARLESPVPRWPEAVAEIKL